MKSHINKKFLCLNSFQSNFTAAVQQSTSSPPIPAFLNAQIKPKVSSPAPSKIYGQPGSLSTDPIKSDLGLKSINQNKQDPMLTEPPPAHSHSRNQQKYLLPLSSAVSPFDLPIGAGGAAAAMPLSHSPGIHTASPIPASALVLPPPTMPLPPSLMVTTPSTLHNSMLIDIQSIPLDLGISNRHRNSTANNNNNNNSPITRTISSTPPSPIALSITKATAAAATATIITPLNVQKANDSGEFNSRDLRQQHFPTIHGSLVREPMIKVPIITVTAADTVGVATTVAGVASPQEQSHIRSYEIDDTSNSSCNSRYENNVRLDGAADTAADQLIVANGTISSKSVPIAIAPPPPSTNKSKSIANDCNQQRPVHESTPPLPSLIASNCTHTNPLRTSSADGLLRSSSTNSSPVPSPNSAQSAPATPIKCPNDYEKSSSPGEFFSKRIL